MPPTYYIPESRFDDDLRRRLAETHERNVAMNDPAAFARRKNAMRDAEMERQRILHGDFAQQAALQKALQGTWDRRAQQERDVQGTFGERAAEARALQGTWDQRAQQERDVQGTFQGREEGLERRQGAQLAAEMERAKLAEEGASWRRMYEPTHYGQEITVDDEGNTIHRTVPFQYGQRIDQQAEAEPILPQVAPKGFNDVNHLLAVYENVPQNQRSQFLTEAGAQYPDLFKQARNEMAKRSKTGAGPNPTMATAPAAAASVQVPIPTVPPKPATSPAASVARVKRDIETPYYPPTVSGGDTNALTFREPSAPQYSPPDTTSYITRGGLEPNLQPGAPMPSFNTGIRRAMPTPATYEPPVRHPMPSSNPMVRQPMPTLPEPDMTPTAIQPRQPEAPQAYLPRRSRNVIASLQSQMNEPSLLDRSRWKKPRSSLIVG